MLVNSFVLSVWVYVCFFLSFDKQIRCICDEVITHLRQKFKINKESFWYNESFICSETKIEYGVTPNTWTLSKTHQAQTNSYGGFSEKETTHKIHKIYQNAKNTYHKCTFRTLEKSGKIDLVDWALETGDGTKIISVSAKAPCIYNMLTENCKSLLVCVKHRASWIICTGVIMKACDDDDDDDDGDDVIDLQCCWTPQTLSW